MSDEVGVTNGIIRGVLWRCAGYFGVFMASFVFAFICGSMVFLPGAGSAAGVAAKVDVGVELASVIALSVNPGVLDLRIQPTPTGWQTTEELVADVSTNNLTGYTLNMSASGEETVLAHTNGVNVIPSTDAVVASDLDVNTWGYNIGADAVAFLAVPGVDTPDSVGGADEPVARDETLVTVGAKVDTTLPSGLYSGSLSFTAVTNEVPGPMVIAVVPNTAVMAGDTITVIGSNFYAGIGEPAVDGVKVGVDACLSFEVIDDETLTCVVPKLLESGSYPVTVTTFMGASSRNVLIAYTTVPTTMQAMKADYCANDMVEGDVIVLTDRRDGQDYRVRKMPDGKCWMIDNLKYAPESTVEVPYILINALGMSTDTGYWIDPTNRSYCLGSTNMPLGSLTRCGYYYNWYGATWGTGNTSVTGPGVTVTGSICPNNDRPGNVISSPWRLPSGNFGTTDDSTLGDYGVLDVAMGGTGSSMNSMNHVRDFWGPTGIFEGVLGGSWGGTNWYWVGDIAYYWTSSISSTNPYSLFFQPAASGPGSSIANNRNTGYPIRCLIDP